MTDSLPEFFIEAAHPLWSGVAHGRARTVRRASTAAGARARSRAVNATIVHPLSPALSVLDDTPREIADPVEAPVGVPVRGAGVGSRLGMFGLADHFVRCGNRRTKRRRAGGAHAGALRADQVRAGRSGAAGLRLSYNELNQIDLLLTLQQPIPGAPDALFFVAAHQITELWFKVILHELDAARRRSTPTPCRRPGAGWPASRAARRCWSAICARSAPSPRAISRSCAPQLGTSSAYESAQFREIEFVSGPQGPPLPEQSPRDRRRARPV